MIFLSLIRNPYQQTSHFKNKLKWLVIFTFGNLLINIPFVFLLDFTEDSGIENFIDKLSFIEQLIFIAALPAFFEEFIFRYPLNLKAYSIDIIFILTIPFSILSITNFSQNSLYVCPLLVLLYLIFKKFIQHIISKMNRLFVFYGVALLFATSHTGNFLADPILTTIVLLILAFISGVLFGLVRVHVGFKHAILSHFFYNATIVCIGHVAS